MFQTRTPSHDQRKQIGLSFLLAGTDPPGFISNSSGVAPVLVCHPVADLVGGSAGASRCY